MPDTAADRIRHYLDANRARAESFLAELVKVPSDNPPGDCAAHAAPRGGAARRAGPRGRAAPRARGAGARQRHGQLHQPRRPPHASARAARRSRSTPMATWSRPARAGPRTRSAPRWWTAGCTAAASRSRSPTSPPTPSPSWRWRSLERSGTRLNGTVELHLTYDEEAGGEIGPSWLIEQGLTRPDLALGAGFSYAVVTAHNGCLHLEVQVDGRSAHAAMPFTGVDALEAATAILSALYALAQGLAERVSAIARHRLARSSRSG